MNLSNRIYSRKVLFRLIYMYNFYNFILSKSIYVNIANKVDNIVKLWFDKIDDSEFKRYDFTSLLSIKSKYDKKYSIQDYTDFFDINNEEFKEFLSYTADKFVNKKDWVSLEYNFIVKNLDYLKQYYDHIIDDINSFLNTFKFSEVNSVDQAILLLAFSEYRTYKTPKWILIKEAMMLSDIFSSNSKLINAVLDKLLDL